MNTKTHTNFESWYLARRRHLLESASAEWLFLKSPDGRYEVFAVQEAWETWQAALESPVIQELVDVLGEIIQCPQYVDEATIPSGGIEVNPAQVVMQMSVSLVRLRKAKAALDNFQKLNT